VIGETMEPGPTAGHLLSFVPGVSVAHGNDGSAWLLGPDLFLPLTGPLLDLSPAIESLLAAPAEREELAGLVQPELLPLWEHLLCGAETSGLLCRTLRAQENRSALVTMVPTSRWHRYTCQNIALKTGYLLSRFAYFRREESSIVVESPLAHCKLVLYEPETASLLHQLREPRQVAELRTTVLEVSDIIGLLDLCVAAHVVEQHGDIAEAEVSRLWEFHDLVFHARSRTGRHRNPSGAIYPYLGTEIRPLPALKGRTGQPLLSLPRSIDQPTPRTESSLAHVLAKRRSIRNHGVRAISKDELGYFLDRTSSQHLIIETPNGELGKRPYPGGGALYELEVYVVANNCEGLTRGVYYYRPGDHALELVAQASGDMDRLLHQAARSLDSSELPQVLLVLTARFRRLSWKYRSIVYSLVLKHVGIVTQTMYLVATDMGLAPCAVGIGDSELFSRISGLDYLSESSVGEFCIGCSAD
jgi:oxazoline/thiazoline dehydrogenase